MARLHPKSYPGDWEFKRGEDIRIFSDRSQKQLAAIPQDRIVRFPFADGHALYFVYSEKPLVLQHIPYGDAWHVDQALIRGLRLVDIKQRVAADRKLHAIFEKPFPLSR
jgi:hypothetical protein